MRICDIPEDQIHVGIKVRGMETERIGTVIGRDDRVPGRDPYWWIQFEGEDQPTSGFFWNDCECEVVEGTFQPAEKSYIEDHDCHYCNWSRSHNLEKCRWCKSPL